MSSGIDSGRKGPEWRNEDAVPPVSIKRLACPVGKGSQPFSRAGDWSRAEPAKRLGQSSRDELVANSRAVAQSSVRQGVKPASRRTCRGPIGSHGSAFDRMRTLAQAIRLRLFVAAAATRRQLLKSASPGLRRSSGLLLREQGPALDRLAKDRRSARNRRVSSCPALRFSRQYAVELGRRTSPQWSGRPI